MIRKIKNKIIIRMGVPGSSSISAEENLCALVRSYIGSPAYHAMISSPFLRGRIGPIAERDFYLALHYFPRRFTAIHERIVTQLCAALVRSEQIIRGRRLIPTSLVWLDSFSTTPLSIGTLFRLTISHVQTALGSQARATIIADLAELATYTYYYQQSHLQYSKCPSTFHYPIERKSVPIVSINEHKSVSVTPSPIAITSINEHKSVPIVPIKTDSVTPSPLIKTDSVTLLATPSTAIDFGSDNVKVVSSSAIDFGSVNVDFSNVTTSPLDTTECVTTNGLSAITSLSLTMVIQYWFVQSTIVLPLIRHTVDFIT